MLEVLPPATRAALERQGDWGQLLGGVLDLGRLPEARFPGSVVYLSGTPTTREDIKHITSRVGAFGKDNRAGIERTLHRISAIRNRQGEVIGLTCRVGRAVFGFFNNAATVNIYGQSILLLGRP